MIRIHTGLLNDRPRVVRRAVVTPKVIGPAVTLGDPSDSHTDANLPRKGAAGMKGVSRGDVPGIE